MATPPTATELSIKCANLVIALDEADRLAGGLADGVDKIIDLLAESPDCREAFAPSLPMLGCARRRLAALSATLGRLERVATELEPRYEKD